MLQHSGYSADFLIEWMKTQRQHTRAFIQQCAGDEGRGPQAAELNPPLWEWCHLIWFWEYWCLRCRDGLSPSQASVIADADRRFNSALIAHEARWHCELPNWPASLDYAETVMDQIIRLLKAGTINRYFVELSLHHEAMHEENFMRRAQWLGLPFRQHAAVQIDKAHAIFISEQTLTMGATTANGFIFDNEKWAHENVVGAFTISSEPVSEFDFATFLDNQGYRRDEYWSAAGKAWRQQHLVDNQPVYWRQTTPGDWLLRDGDEWRKPNAQRAMIYVNYYEAQAYANYAHAMLPTAAQWHAASAHFTLRPLWEWTADAFNPYPGFVADPYADYSAPSFHLAQELRGASPLSHFNLSRPGFRNFFAPQRRDICAGFRLCWPE